MGWFKKLTGGIFEPISQALADVDDTVREKLPGGWTLPALLAGGYVFAPEIGAFFNSATGATVPASAVQGAGAGAVSTTTPGLLGSSMSAGTFANPAVSNSLLSYLPSANTALTAGSSLLGAGASLGAARTMADANRAMGDVNYKIYQEQKALQEPWRQAGEEALNKLRSPEMQYSPFTADKFQADPGYAFRLSEGMKALDRTAASRGGLLSGATLKGAQRYGQDLGSQEFQNAYNRYNTDYSMRLAPLQTLAGYGQSATNNLTNTAGAYGANQAENIATRGNIGATSYMSAADALARGASQYLRNESDNALIAALRRA
jgi:hypothetical protein